MVRVYHVQRKILVYHVQWEHISLGLANVEWRCLVTSKFAHRQTLNPLLICINLKRQNLLLQPGGCDRRIVLLIQFKIKIMAITYSRRHLPLFEIGNIANNRRYKNYLLTFNTQTFVCDRRVIIMTTSRKVITASLHLSQHLVLESLTFNVVET